MVKKIVLAMAVMAVSASGLLMAQKRQVMLDKVVAVVGGSAILYSDVENYASLLVEQRRAQGYTSDRDPMNEALEALMKQKLLYSQALIDSVEMMGDVPSYVEQQIQAMIAEAGSIAALEARQHMPIYAFRDILTQRITEQEYANSMQNTVINDVTVTPGEVERYFKSLKEEELPLVPKQYMYAQIVRYPASKDVAKQRARERLLEMRERIITGKSSMPVLARLYSADPGSAMRGGELSYGPLSQWQPSFAEAAGELKPGQLSEIVETEFGLHIIELMEEPKNGNYRLRHILVKPTYTADELLEPTRMLDSIADLIRADSITFEDAAREFSEDPLTKMNGGLVSNHDLLSSNPSYSNVKFTATKFREEDFGEGRSLKDYVAISHMEVGEVSNAYAAEDLNGNELSKIVKLLEVIPSHPASLNEDYLTIEEMALENKKAKVFEAWLKDKIDGLYVYIDPEFRNGEFEFKNWVK
ncbi:MAG: peptidylprolyl isomerase [Alistipes sp.]|nr:peptidylprolyl isomerase [Alistipes sp.]